MSVFQLQEWWSVQCCEEEEEFDTGCLCIGNLDNADPPSNKIAVGSLAGKLRIYSPSSPSYKVDDLIIEFTSGQPILQLLSGQFIPASSGLGIAVLHPRKLVIYELTAKFNSNEKTKAQYHSLEKIYEHDLGLGGKHFTAYNMTSGYFGGVQGREMIMVQSLDGKLQIFEQSANAFTRQQVDCILPGPVAYLNKIDAFVTTNYSCHAECYRYNVLANAQADVGRDTLTGSFGLVALRSAVVEWNINLGEPCRQIVPGIFSKSVAQAKGTRVGGEILLLCDHSLFLVKDSGGILQQRRLEVDPSCICAYTSPQSSNFLLANQDCTIQVYSNFNLVWATKVDSVPVQMVVADFGNQNGLIVTINDTGKLSLGYLGTKLPNNNVMTHTREMDYDKMDEEHRRLLQIIRESQSEPNSKKSSDILVIKSQVTKAFDREPISSDYTPKNTIPMSSLVSGVKDRDGIKVSVRLFFSCTGTEMANNVDIAITTASGLHAVPKNITLEKVSGKATPTVIKVYFYVTGEAIPNKLEATVVATYKTAKGEPRIASHTISLPLHLICRLKGPSKSAIHKLTLDTEHSAIPLTDLFDDMLLVSKDCGVDISEVLGPSATNAMGFQFWTNSFIDIQEKWPIDKKENGNVGSVQPTALVSVLVSKQAGRYRVQSDSLPAMLIVIAELEKRIRLRISETSTISNMDTLISCTDNVPLDEYFYCINEHFNTRVQMNEQLSKLNDLAHQFRIIQKRLLTRFKDRNPVPLKGMDILMKETYHNIIIVADAIETNQIKLRNQMEDIEGVSRIIAKVVGMKYKLDSKESNYLLSLLCPDLRDGINQGWEETVDTAMTYCLKTSLAKTPKAIANLSNNIEIPNNIDNLKKHITMVIDRLSKGVKLIHNESNGRK